MRAPTLVLGIDEAGRGARIGPLVVAAVAVDVARLADLAAFGIRDSKTLSAAQRRRHHALIAQHAVWSATESAGADVVDSYAGRLNELERELATRLLARAPDVSTVVADGRAIFSPLQERFPRLRACDHADADHPAVMLAALLAKIERDRCFDRLDEQLTSICGKIPRRGYPGAATNRWLKLYEKFFPVPQGVVRRSFQSKFPS